MVSNELKQRVAQNCNSYKSKYKLQIMNSITYESESCSSCVNYVNENCSEGIFDEISEIIRIN